MKAHYTIQVQYKVCDGNSVTLQDGYATESNGSRTPSHFAQTRQDGNYCSDRRWLELVALFFFLLVKGGLLVKLWIFFILIRGCLPLVKNQSTKLLLHRQ